MNYREYLPAQELQLFIHRYGIVEMQESLQAPVREKLAPAPANCWVFSKAKQSLLLIDHESNLFPLSPVIEISQNARNTTIVHKGGFRLFFVQFMPGIRLRMEQANQWQADTTALSNYFNTTHSWEQMVQFANHYFVHRTISAKEPDRIASETIRRIHSNPSYPLNDLSRAVFFSPRHLRRVFSLHTGMPIKAYQQIVRFSHSIQQLEAGTDKRILEIACRNGFSDQTHFNKEFKLFTGLTPRQYLSGNFPLTTGLMWRDGNPKQKFNP